MDLQEINECREAFKIFDVDGGNYNFINININLYIILFYATNKK